MRNLLIDMICSILLIYYVFAASPLGVHFVFDGTEHVFMLGRK